MQPIEFQGEELIADASGALYWPAESCLIAADLHLEKGSAFALRGVLLPPYDSRVTLSTLAQAAARHNARRIIALGDSFHDAHGSARLAASDRDAIFQLMRGREWIWIAGNHDPAPPDLGGVTLAELALGPIVFRHEPRPGMQPGEIAGHLHPCATVRGSGSRIRRRCFVGDGTRLVMPAMGAYAGGLDIFDAAFERILCGRHELIVLGRERAFRVAECHLLRNAA